MYDPRFDTDYSTMFTGKVPCRANNQSRSKVCRNPDDNLCLDFKTRLIPVVALENAKYVPPGYYRKRAKSDGLALLVNDQIYENNQLHFPEMYTIANDQWGKIN